MRNNQHPVRDQPFSNCAAPFKEIGPPENLYTRQSMSSAETNQNNKLNLPWTAEIYFNSKTTKIYITASQQQHQDTFPVSVWPSPVLFYLQFVCVCVWLSSEKGSWVEERQTTVGPIRMGCKIGSRNWKTFAFGKAYVGLNRPTHASMYVSACMFFCTCVCCWLYLASEWHRTK